MNKTLKYLVSDQSSHKPIDYSISVISQFDDLEDAAIIANKEYRNGTPILSDWEYDHILIEAIKLKNPNSILLTRIEPDEFVGKTVQLPVRMMSTDKAYSKDEIQKWINRIHKANRGLPTTILVTPKLDGFSGYKELNKFYTRGDGYNGTDISRVLDRGLQVKGKITNGKGEIVVDKKYFNDVLSEFYDNSRNIISSVIKEGELTPEIKTAIELGKVVFYPFCNLPSETFGSDEDFDINELWDKLITNCEYDTDGLVLEVMDGFIKEQMGATGHHYCWQLAFKINSQAIDVPVLSVTPQTSKVGRIIPVVELEPTEVSGVIISRATGHHYKNIISQGIDSGAIVQIVRSGEVIPYIAGVTKKADIVNIPDKCPSCGSETIMDGDNLWCTNEIDCPAQIERTIEYFFKTLGNIDGFGSATIEQLVSNGYNSVVKIYGMNINDFINCGFGKKTSENLFNQLQISKSIEIPDWRFLAAFSINSVGKGGAEKLLQKYSILEIFDLTKSQIVLIAGFGETLSNNLIESLIKIKPDFDVLYSMGFNLTESKNEIKIMSKLSGKTVVFTGTFGSESRSDLEANAKYLGMKVGSSVSSKTDYLIIGDKVGATKTEAAKKYGVTVLTEQEYLWLIK